jgi:CheY-like chemotaxis protein
MGARVAVIEDNRDNLELVTILLRALGHEPITATTGAEGIELVRREQPDIVLLDLTMPEMDGFETLRELRGDAGTRRIPVVALTAHAMVGDREAIMAQGFDGYVPKPIAVDQLVEQLGRHLTDGSRPARGSRARRAG